MQQQPIFVLSATATVAVIANRFVGFNGAMVDTLGAKPMGVADYDAEVGDEFAVNVIGTASVEAGAAIPLGDKGLTPVMSDAQGRAIPYVVAAGNVIAGYARQSASAAGSSVEVLLVV